LLGNGEFYPPEALPINHALYSQSRFWNVQYRDLKADWLSGDSNFLYEHYSGSRDDRGIVSYDNVLPSTTKIVWFPAYSTVNKSCDQVFNYNRYCCNPSNANDQNCINATYDASIYLEQAHTYAKTLSTHPGNKVLVQLVGSEHNFLTQEAYWKHAADDVLAEFP